MRFEAAAPALAAAGAEPLAAAAAVAVEALVSPAAAAPATPSFDSSSTRFLFSGRASSVVMFRAFFDACSLSRPGHKEGTRALPKARRESNLNARD